VAAITSGLTAAIFSFQMTQNVWIGVGLALLVSLFIGWSNGYIRVKTGIHSFLVTLGMFLMLQGLNLAVTRLITGQVATNDISDMDGFSSAQKIFASSFTVGSVSIKISVVWWLLFVLIATWILLRT